MANIEERVESLIKSKIEDIGYKLYDVEYAKEGKNYFLRIFIDSDNGIDLNDCEKVNDEISDLLDQVDYIKEQYFLEVSSPGIERVLRKDRHLDENKEKEVSVNLFKKNEQGRKELVGVLKEFDDNTITIEEQNENVIIDRKNISQIKTIYNWN